MNRLKKAADRLINEILAVGRGETVVVTCDDGTDRQMTLEIAEAAREAGALPLIIENQAPEGKGVLTEAELPTKVLAAALCQGDVWIEINRRQLLYSRPFEIAMERNKNLRYMVLAEMTPDVFVRTIGEVDTVQMRPLMKKLKEIIDASRTVRVKTALGTDAVLELEHRHFLALDCGEASEPGFHTMAGCINIVPKFDGVNGTAVFDGTLTDWGLLGNQQVKITVKDGTITAIEGGEAAGWFSDYLKAFNDPNMYKIAHLSIGLNPGAVFSGSTPEDERGWGVTTWGIGNVTAEDAPPHGRKAVSHCDGTSSKSTIWFDDRLIMKDGEFADRELIELAKALRR